MLELLPSFTTTELYAVLNLIPNILSLLPSHFLLLEYYENTVQRSPFTTHGTLAQ